MRILGIETSCDETAAAIVEDGTKVLSSVVASSEAIHKKYGGIVPEKAAREQLKSMIPVINEAMKQWSNETIDAIAVTVGPGLIGSLLIGVETAKTLAWLWKKPIIPVNHLIAHIYANFLNLSAINNQQLTIPFPSLCLVVSGGHTELFLMKGHGKYQWIGGTRDDASGECFDKCARLLGLGYPGGPAIAAAAALCKRSDLCLLAGPTLNKIKLPRPMIDQDNFDFSFSGLKTAVLNLTKQFNNETMKQLSNQIAYELQEAIADVLVTKTLKAAQRYKVKSILVGGGVTANARLREKFNLTMKQPAFAKATAGRCNNETIKLFIPPVSLCTDNAAIIASAAYFNYQPILWPKIKAQPSSSFANP